MSKCIDDGGTCGLGGYCNKCPHVDNTPEREALIDRNKVAELVDDYALQVQDRGHDASNPWITADKIITTVEQALSDKWQSRVIDIINDTVNAERCPTEYKRLIEAINKVKL